LPRASFEDAFAPGALCGVAAALGGFLGHVAGARLYPQRYEQIPSDFFFLPVGLVLGFICGVTARRAYPKWSTTRMLALVVLSATAYGGFMFGYARSRAVPAQVSITFEPDPGVAVSCDPAACPTADPPFEWTVRGNLRLQETSGLGGTVDAIALASYEERPRRPGTITTQDAQEDNKFAGPNVRLTGRQIAGAHRVRAHEMASYPIQYSYRTRTGGSARAVSVYVEFTDAAGHPAVFVGRWNVR